LEDVERPLVDFGSGGGSRLGRRGSGGLSDGSCRRGDRLGRNLDRRTDRRARDCLQLLVETLYVTKIERHPGKRLFFPQRHSIGLVGQKRKHLQWGTEGIAVTLLPQLLPLFGTDDPRVVHELAKGIFIHYTNVFHCAICACKGTDFFRTDKKTIAAFTHLFINHHFTL